MKKQMAKLLQRRADEVAKMFSRHDRGGNYDNEIFHVEAIEVLSEVTAAVTFRKDPTDKRAIAWFYFINSRSKPRWEYFFVTYSHLVGLNRVSQLLHRIEQHNFLISVNS